MPHSPRTAREALAAAAAASGVSYLRPRMQSVDDFRRAPDSAARPALIAEPAGGPPRRAGFSAAASDALRAESGIEPPERVDRCASPEPFFVWTDDPPPDLGVQLVMRSPPPFLCCNVAVTGAFLIRA